MQSSLSRPCPDARARKWSLREVRSRSPSARPTPSRNRSCLDSVSFDTLDACVRRGSAAMSLGPKSRAGRPGASEVRVEAHRLTFLPLEPAQTSDGHPPPAAVSSDAGHFSSGTDPSLCPSLLGRTISSWPNGPLHDQACPLRVHRRARARRARPPLPWRTSLVRRH